MFPLSLFCWWPFTVKHLDSWTHHAWFGCRTHIFSLNTSISMHVCLLSIVATVATVATFTKEVLSRLAERPLVFNGRLADRGLTSLVKMGTGVKSPPPPPLTTTTTTTTTTKTTPTPTPTPLITITVTATANVLLQLLPLLVQIPLLILLIVLLLLQLLHCCYYCYYYYCYTIRMLALQIIYKHSITLNVHCPIFNFQIIFKYTTSNVIMSTLLFMNLLLV